MRRNSLGSGFPIGMMQCRAAAALACCALAFGATQFDRDYKIGVDALRIEA